MTASAPKQAGLLARLRNLLPARSTVQRKSSSSLPGWLGAQSYYFAGVGKPVWSSRNYTQFADEAYVRNVISYRCIAMIAQGAACVPWRLHATGRTGRKKEIHAHPLLQLLKAPNPFQGGAALVEEIFTFRLIAGNAFVQAVGPKESPPLELYTLRPDRVAVIAGRDGVPAGYRYTVGEQAQDFPVDRLSGRSRLLHIKAFHPLDDWYGLSPIEAAAYSIDQHNEASAWNQALLQNGARPSGALVVKGGENGAGTHLSEEQYWRIKQQMEEQFSGPANAGRPLLLEGGLDWREMSLSPKDMDFLNCKNSAARDIALAFGVPPQLLGIPGDNTYSNLAEARLALWEQTILPMLDSLCDGLNGWLIPMFGGGLELSYDADGISALSLRREKIWERVEKASFLTADEKRAAVGYGPLTKAVPGAL